MTSRCLGEGDSLLNIPKVAKVVETGYPEGDPPFTDCGSRRILDPRVAIKSHQLSSPLDLAVQCTVAAPIRKQQLLSEWICSAVTGGPAQIQQKHRRIIINPFSPVAICRTSVSANIGRTPLERGAAF